MKTKQLLFNGYSVGKQKICLLIIVIGIAAIAISLVWYFSTIDFLRGVEPSDVKSMSVFDGNTGQDFDISDTGEIRYIVENIQDNKMERDKVSIGYSGYGFRVYFYDKAGKKIESFIINSADTIRKDPFFYRCDGDLCYDYLEELEDEYAN